MPAARRLQKEEVAANTAPTLADAVAGASSSVSHNLQGQKLGRKGRDTRERILAAAVELLESCEGEPISMSAVARKASLGMTSLYNYFNDFTELLLAVLEPVMATAEDAYLALLRERWPDDELPARCRDFICAYHRFWAKNSRLLHMRNSMADMRDRRMMLNRVESTQPIIALLVMQMDGEAGIQGSPASAMAAMIMTAVERSITIATDRELPALMGWDEWDEERYQTPGARLMELAIRDIRSQAKG